MSLNAAPLVQPSARSRRGQRIWFYAKLLITVGMFAGLIHFVSFRELWAAVQRIPASALWTCAITVFLGQMFGVARFQFVLDVYGADWKPRWVESLRLFLSAAFYNTYLPGGMAGDLIRAVAVRRCFTRGGLTSALAVSAVERVIGLAALLILVATVAALKPVAGIKGLLPFALIGIAGAASAIAAVVVGRRLAPHLPGKLREIAESLPRMQKVMPFWLSLGSAIATQAATALGFHAIIASLSPNATVSESLIIVPLACSAMYIPATIAGAGTRDAAFVFLYRAVGVPAADALAMSLMVLMSNFLMGALGGIATLIPPFEDEAP